MPSTLPAPGRNLDFVADVVQLTLEGPGAEPGRIPAGDVARLLADFERAVARAAETRVRRKARTGRRGGPVEAATRLVLRRIGTGSLVAELELPELDGADALALEDAHLGVLATRDVLDLIDDPDRPGGDDWTAEALADLGEHLGLGVSYPSLTVEWSPASGPARRVAYGAETRARLSARRQEAAAPAPRDDRVVGTLVEADFERHTARVTTGDRTAVTVSFAEDLADDIHRWLRRPGELEGSIEFDPRSGAALRVELHRIVRPVQLRVVPDDQEFFRRRRVEGLAAEQGVAAIDDLDALADASATKEELDAFLDALGS